MDKRQQPVPALVVLALLLALGGASLAVACSGDSTEPTPAIATITATVSQPTPSPLPATPPAIDTSAWLTYTSPYHGFSIMYPPDWTLLEPRHISLAVEILNSKAAAESARRAVEGITEFPTLQPGEAWVRVSLGPPVPFDIESLSTICTGIAERMLNGFRAAQCGSGSSYTLYVEKPDGGILQIVTKNIGHDLATAQALETTQVLKAIRSTIVFERE